MSQDLNLTVSCALEFLLASTDCSTPQEALDVIHIALSEPITFQCKTCHANHKFWLPISDQASPGSEWSVTAEHEEESGEMNIFRVRITSRRMSKSQSLTTVRSDDRTHMHEVSMKSEIAAVLQQLEGKLGNLERSGNVSNFLYIDSSCKMHTTIADSKSDIPLPTIKRVAQMLTLWQRQFDTLRSVNQVSDSTLFSASLGSHLDAWLRLLHRIAGNGSMTQLLSGLRSQGYLNVDTSGPHNSLKFSMASSTFDADKIMAWIDLTTKLVSRCHFAEDSFFAWQISHEGEYRQPDFTHTDMLRTLACKKSSILYFKACNKIALAAAESQLALALDAVGRGEAFGLLAMQNANVMLSQVQPGAVEEKIAAKLNADGYGKFDRHHRFAILLAIRSLNL